MEDPLCHWAEYLLFFFSPSARGPDEVIARYWKVFKGYKSFPLVPSAKFAEFKDQHTTKHKLCDFAGKCRDAIRDIDDNVRELKKSGILLLVEKGDFWMDVVLMDHIFKNVKTLNVQGN